jgi:hypothetical protein
MISPEKMSNKNLNWPTVPMARAYGILSEELNKLD